ncbi:MAG TPA: hypothetical protein VN855_00535 [Candidatus Acidoferrum sp.]|nr:hypothetical protein [Candidatus Acidoferrum sp.]
MNVEVDEIEGPYYMDVVLSPSDVDKIKFGEMVDGFACVNGKRFYVGARMDRSFEYEKKDLWIEENWESDDRV